MFRFADLFSGIGGFRLALEDAGGQCVLSCEIDKFARKTYLANFDVKESFYSDIQDIPSYEIPAFDVLTAGFPCQSFSISGRGSANYLGKPTGLEDTRGTLFYEIARILEIAQPKIFILENVRGLLNHDKGRTFATISKVLMDLGYTVSFDLFSSETLVPQKRERLFIIGYRSRTKMTKYAAAQVKTWVEHSYGPNPTLKSIMEPDVDEKYTLSDTMWSWLQKHKQKHIEKGNHFGYSLFGPNDVARTLTTRYWKDGSEILIKQKGKNPRKLTPIECKRLMGFPETFIFPVSDTQAYRQLGNSVVVPLVKSIVSHVVTPNFPKREKSDKWNGLGVLVDKDLDTSLEYTARRRDDINPATVLQEFLAAHPATRIAEPDEEPTVQEGPQQENAAYIGDGPIVTNRPRSVAVEGAFVEQMTRERQELRARIINDENYNAYGDPF